MKNLLFLLVCVLSISAFGQQKLKLYLDNKQYFAPSIGNYVELQFEFSAPSMRFKGVPGGLMSELAVDIRFKQNGVEITQDSYKLNSPLMKDSIIENFYDVRRYPLAPGDYVLDIQLFDVSADDEGVKASVPVVIKDMSGSAQLSPVQLVEFARNSEQVNSPFYKSGLEILPRLSNYYPENLSILPYYFEVYGTNRFTRPVFGIKQRLIDQENQNEVEQFTRFIKMDTGAVAPSFQKIDIQSLQTGTYSLELTLLDGEMKEISRSSVMIDRVNDPIIQMTTENLILDPNFEKSITRDSAMYYLASLIPIAKSETQRVIMDALKDKNPEKALKTIQAFWVASTSGSEAYTEWMKYKQQVQWVEKLYHTNFQDGYETDRGRVYLQYGTPTNIIQREASASEYPFEIWQYNKIGRFSNKRFIFYNPDLLGNNYSLLHSDMLGEIKNNNWQLTLNQRNTTRGNIDDPNQNVNPHYGGNSNDLFRQY